MKKGILAATYVLVSSLFLLEAVSARQTEYIYESTVPQQQTAYVGGFTASYNYAFAYNEVNNSFDGAAIHSTLQTEINGNYVTIGKKLKMDGAGHTGVSLWHPSAITNNPSDLNIKTSATCAGSNTTSNLCIIAQSKYRLKLSNENWINQFHIYARFVFRDV